MNEIPDLRADIAFLKKFDFRSKGWMEIRGKKKDGSKKKVKSNFLLHPRKLNSDSECSSLMPSPTKFTSASVTKQTSLDEFNNNISQRESFNMTCVETNFINCNAEISTEKIKSNKTVVCKRKPSIATVASTNSPVLKNGKIRLNSRFDNFEKKYSNLAEKSIKLLNKIRQIFENGIGSPDGEEDLIKRQKRLQEFMSRFSRNYLYPLLRQVEELNSSQKLPLSIINRKLLYAQQFVFNGLQAYYNYLPSSVEKCGSEKLKEFLQQIVSLCNIYDLLKDKKNETTEFVKVLFSQTELLIQTVDTFNLKLTEKNESIKEGKKKPKNKDKKKSKLSMYAQSASFRKDLEWKKAVEALAKKKFNVKSRYKTSQFKHRPPMEKPHIVQLPCKVQLYQKRSSATLKSTPIRSPIREDDIQTLVEAELEAPPNSGELLNHENNIASSERLAPDSDPEVEKEEEEEGSVRKALEVLKKFFGDSVQQNQFFEKITSEIKKKLQPEKDEGEKVKKKLAPVVTITGAKNAKLICIRDDNSADDENEEKKDKEVMTDVEIKQTSSETQTDLREDVKSKSAIKISRLPKSSRRQLQLLPKEYAIDIIQYKLRYAHFHKQNPMYRKSANVQPWILMGRISDDILDYILQSVTNELEVNEILENLYNAEFQY